MKKVLRNILFLNKKHFISQVLEFVSLKGKKETFQVRLLDLLINESVSVKAS